jgi:phosphoribosyl 1,2-cyclic phosphate phosphodiesterase
MPFRLDHGEIDALGFRFNNIVYSPDFKSIYPESMACLEGLDLWIIDGLRHTIHPTHISIPEALAFAHQYRSKRTVLTNLSSEVDYEQLRSELPKGVEAAHDLMVLTV